MKTPNPKITCPECGRPLQLGDYNSQCLIIPHHRHSRSGKKCPRTFSLIKIAKIETDTAKPVPNVLNPEFNPQKK